MPVVTSKSFNGTGAAPTLVSQNLEARFKYDEGSGLFTTDSVSMQSFNRGGNLSWGSDATGTHIVAAGGLLPCIFTTPWSSPSTSYSAAAWVTGNSLGLSMWGQDTADHIAMGAYQNGTSYVLEQHAGVYNPGDGSGRIPYALTTGLKHVVWVVDNGTFSFYIDSVKVIDSQACLNFVFGDDDWLHWSPFFTVYGSYYFNGKLYDTAIWNGAFSDADVTAMYNAGVDW